MSSSSSKSCTLKPVLLLVTHAPSHPLATLALRFAKSFLHQNMTKTEGNTASLLVFFYGDGAMTANALAWQPEDQTNITKQWQQLAITHNIHLPVCVSTALARGVTDSENSKRHTLASSNIADGFDLVGLSALVLAMTQHKVIQF